MRANDTQELIQPSDARFHQKLVEGYYALAPFDSETHADRYALDMDYRHAVSLMKEVSQHPTKSSFQNTTLYCLSRLIYDNPDVASYVPDKKHPKDLLHLAIEMNDARIIAAVLEFTRKNWTSALKNKDQLDMALMAFAAPRDDFKLGMQLVRAGASLTFVPDYKALGLEPTGDTPLMYYLKLPAHQYIAKKLPSTESFPYGNNVPLLTHQNADGETLFSLLCKTGYPFEVKTMCEVIRNLPQEADYKAAVNLEKAKAYLEKRLDRLDPIEHESDRNHLSYVYYLAGFRNIKSNKTPPSSLEMTAQAVNNAVSSVKETLNALQGEFDFGTPVPPRVVVKAAVPTPVKEQIIEDYLPGLGPV